MGGVDGQWPPLSPCEKVVCLPALDGPSDKEKDVFPVEEETVLSAVCAILSCVTFRQPSSSSLTGRLLRLPVLVEDARFHDCPS